MSKAAVDVPLKGGFSFDLCKRNEMLSKKGVQAPKFLKTGTTIVGWSHPWSISRATEGPIVADKNCEKIHFMSPNIYYCGAGTAADTEAMTEMDELVLEAELYWTIWQLLHFLKDYIFWDRCVWKVFG